jgi:hypothetical protein
LQRKEIVPLAEDRVIDEVVDIFLHVIVVRDKLRGRR